MEAGGQVADRDRDEPLFTIGVVAEMLNAHPQTLRLYEREGLVKPSRPSGNTRVYSQRDVEQIRAILHLTRDLGVNLAGVAVILSMREPLRKMQQSIEELTEFIQTFMGEEFEAWMSKRRRSLVRTGSGKVVKLSFNKT